MTSFLWSGVVTRGDAYRVNDDDDPYGDILIGGIDWLAEVEAAKWSRAVIVGIGDERFIGEPDASLGWGYSEWTAMDPDAFRVGPHDILGILARMEGQVVVLSVSDETVNLMEVRERSALAPGSSVPSSGGTS